MAAKREQNDVDQGKGVGEDPTQEDLDRMPAIRAGEDIAPSRGGRLSQSEGELDETPVGVVIINGGMGQPMGTTMPQFGFPMVVNEDGDLEADLPAWAAEPLIVAGRVRRVRRR